MPAHRIGIVPMTPAERQARHRAKLRQHSQTTPPAPVRRIPPRPQAVGGGDRSAHRSAGRIPRLARQPPGQSRRIEAGREAASDRRTRPRRAADDRPTARLRPRLTQEVRPPTPPNHHDQIAELDARDYPRSFRIQPPAQRGLGPFSFSSPWGISSAAPLGPGDDHIDLSAPTLRIDEPLAPIGVFSFVNYEYFETIPCANSCTRGRRKRATRIFP